MPSDYKAITEYNEDQLGKDTSSRKTQVSMYSDPTHFVYEILQNADDYGATEVLFKLSKDNIVIEHNGVPFKEKNVEAITYFGKSTSREDLVKTGRFGIGFKSVFAFTATPIIISGSEHFQIYGLYRVREYPYPDSFSRSRTRIILPFNHESKQPNFVEELMFKEEAYQQISECLVGLDMNTLLFTRNIREIRWEIGDLSGCYSREDEIDDNARLTTIKDGKHENTYLVFSKIPTWENEEHKAVEIAFAMDQQHQLVPIRDESLHVLFPTTSRTGLRFILNGPYRTNPARETISLIDSFNIHLLMVTCRLIKELLPKLRDRKHLTLQFLSILPNQEDTLLSFYAPLRDIVVNEFRNQKLTPTKRGDHAPASGLYRINTELSDLISDEDLAILLGKDGSLPFKVDEISQRRDARGRFVQDPNTQFIDNFLNTLQIPDWNITEFVGTLLAQPEVIKSWLGKKSVEDHQKLYALLYDFLQLRWNGTYWYSSDVRLKNRLSDLSIVHCIDDVYRSGAKCFFPSENVEQDDRFPRIVKGIYSSGENEDQKVKARGFLEAINVRQVDEVVEIEAILKLRYVKGTIELRKLHHRRDLEKFIAFLEEKPDKADLFSRYYIFESDNESWGKPRIFFLDLPYQNTSLTEYYRIFDKDSVNRKVALSPKYEKLDIDLEKFTEFARAVGVETKLDIIKQKIPSDHPEYSYLIASAPGGRVTDTSRNEDYAIREFDIFLRMLLAYMQVDYIDKALDIAKLIWQTMCSQPHNCLEARFRKNSSYSDRVGASSLVHTLKQHPWVPQKNSESIFFVRPRDASREQLPAESFSWPKGDSHDTGEVWLEAIEFGEIANKKKKERVEHNQQAKEFGFDSADEANTMAEIANTLKEQGKSPGELRDKLTAGKRRKQRILIELEDAPEKEYEQRLRSVRSTIGTIDRRTHLRARYTIDDNKMECQMCRQPMPFKKRNSDEDYFEAIEALRKDHFPKEHEAQHLALCPECAAKYKEFVKRDAAAQEALYKLLKDSDESEIRFKSNGQTIRIWFEEKHWYDLKTVIDYYENPENSEDTAN